MEKKLLVLLFFTLCAANVVAASVDLSLPVIFRNEGGVQCDLNDNGNWTEGKMGYGSSGCTKYGISPSLTKKDNRDITLEEAASIYNERFFLPLKLDKIKSQGLATEFFDKAVNCGQGTSGILINQSVINFCKIVKGVTCPVIMDKKELSDEVVDFINQITETNYYSSKTKNKLTKEACKNTDKEGFVIVNIAQKDHITHSKELCITDKSKRILFWLMYRHLAAKRYISIVQKNPRMLPYFLGWMTRTVN